MISCIGEIVYNNGERCISCQTLGVYVYTETHVCLKYTNQRIAVIHSYLLTYLLLFLSKTTRAATDSLHLRRS